MSDHIAFIGGGNMASAIISGLVRQGVSVHNIDVVEPFAEARDRLQAQFGIAAQTQPGPFLARASVVVWAVKPQTFKEAALQVRFHTKDALHVSVAAGIRSDSISHWLGNERVIRTMPNTPALIGKGITALYARAAVTDTDRQRAERIIASTGDFLWLEAESQLDAVTALSGSGPAYMFYFMEAMTAAGAEMGLSKEQAYKLAVATFIGAGELARASNEPPEILRQRVTSKGGTTYAAITAMDASGIKTLFAQALRAAQQRAKELGDEFGES
ncbi:MAG: pyrroline-5-carboxylate reductase [Burkholderiales bacterium RIFCSPLOWO2_12_FULL_61_40]|nr:MAG: pyrroline-5-carboxylate reductase [Burkholderiales bacterium RIFCSPLOWO2_12_FULL_61_40]